ncbi:hypothetical protein [Citrobacter braakii]|uniref:hypothetical protein n=1 Tax=Citrobacter braakii TaxID=57706 RepID=UPI0030810176
MQFNNLSWQSNDTPVSPFIFTPDNGNDKTDNIFICPEETGGLYTTTLLKSSSVITEFIGRNLHPESLILPVKLPTAIISSGHTRQHFSLQRVSCHFP